MIKNNHLATNLEYLRENKGVTLADMAKLCGLSGRSSYAAYEHGAAEPKIDVLIKLADYFGVTLHHLVLVDMAEAQITPDELMKL